MSVLVRAALVAMAALGSLEGQFVQQGAKLVGTGSSGSAWQGTSVALSADGNDAVVGGPSDNGAIGAVWVYMRSNRVWSLQGQMLVGTGAIGPASQGTSVALSADGNTAMVGGPGDNNAIGAVWVYTRSNGVWGQQGQRLVGTGAVGSASQGASVTLSADGNTAVVGGYGDNSGIGAIWIYARSNGLWIQQGQKRVGTNAVGPAQQGISVALSADGNTVVVGGIHDNVGTGAVWVWTRTNGMWSQQGQRLVGTGSSGQAYQGSSVTLSADGNTAFVGGSQDNTGTGAAWAFTRNNGVWSQLGRKLVGTGASGPALQGHAVALSADGKTAVVGGPTDDTFVGAVWVYARGNGEWSQQGKS